MVFGRFFLGVGGRVAAVLRGRGDSLKRHEFTVPYELQINKWSYMHAANLFTLEFVMITQWPTRLIVSHFISLYPPNVSFIIIGIVRHCLTFQVIGRAKKKVRIINQKKATWHGWQFKIASVTFNGNSCKEMLMFVVFKKGKIRWEVMKNEIVRRDSECTYKYTVCHLFVWKFDAIHRERLPSQVYEGILFCLVLF